MQTCAGGTGIEVGKDIENLINTPTYKGKGEGKGRKAPP